MVVESGEGLSSVVPIQECQALPHAVQLLDTAGKDLTRQLTDILAKKGLIFSSPAEIDILNDVKERLCQARDPNENPTADEEYELPDGKKLSLKEERWKVVEPMFDPTILERVTKGIHETCYSSVQMCDKDIRDDVVGSIVLSGGNTLFNNIEGRLKKELEALDLSGVNVIAPEERQFSVWIGGSIMASSTTFEMMCISKQE